LEKDGFEQRVARYRVSEYISLAMFAGSGFAESERRVKCEVDGPQYAVQDQGDLDASFDGFECRWNPIRSTNGVVVSLIVQARGEAESEREAVYGRVLDKLNDLLAGKDGSPVDESTLTLATDPIHFDAEARLKSGSRSGFGYSATRFGISVVATIGRYLLRSRRDALGFPGSVYRNQVVANTDFRKFDGTLRMVLDLTHDQHDKLMDMLRVAHESQDIFFGAHTTEASLMTCVIAAHDGDHIHFVDGSDGGYAMAAKGLKKQIVDAKRN
jgi:hypothetical protein